MSIIRYSLSCILTVLMVLVDVIVILMGGVMALYDGIANHNWQFKGLREYIRSRLEDYVEFWNIVR